MLARIGISEIIIIVLVGLLIFGPQQLPELGRNLGNSIRAFKSAVGEGYEDKADDQDD